MTDLKLRLEQHALWLSDDTKGKRFIATSNEDLRSANLQGANLQDAILQGANFWGANLQDAILQGANFWGANLQGANLQDANFWGANFWGANLQYANFWGASLQYANLQYANFWGASLQYANFQGASLQGASLQYANLSNVKGFKFPPLQITNTKYFITILDDKVLWGCRTFTFDEVRSLTIKDCKDCTWDKDEFKLNKKIVTEMIRYYRKGK